MMAFGFGLLSIAASRAQMQSEQTRSNTVAAYDTGVPEDRHSLANETELSAAVQRMRTAVAVYDMPHVLAAARECRDLAYAEHKIELALHCNRTVENAASDLGDAHVLVRSTYWQARFDTSEVNHGLGSAFVDTDLAQLARTVPPLSVDIEGGNADLDYLRPINIALHARGRTVTASRNLSAVRPEVVASINGNRVNVLIDTGTSVPLVIDQAHAYSLGAIPLVTGLSAPGTLGSSAQSPDTAAFDLVRSFKLGTVVMHNVLAVVVRNGYATDTGVVVGLPVLARYKQVTFSGSRVGLSMDTTPCATSLPLKPALSPTGLVGGMVFPAQVDGVMVKAEFDTGSNFVLLAGPKLTSAPSSSASESAPTTPLVPGLNHRSLDAWIGKFHLTATRVPAGVDNMQADIDIGAPLLAMVDVRLTFSPPSLCIVRMHSTQGP